MTKKEYMKPTMQAVKLKHRTKILAGSADAYGMNRQLQGTQGTSDPEDEVDSAW